MKNSESKILNFKFKNKNLEYFDLLNSKNRWNLSKNLFFYKKVKSGRKVLKMCILVQK